MERLEDMYHNSYSEEQIEQGIAKLYYDLQQFKLKAKKKPKQNKKVFKNLPVREQIRIKSLVLDGYPLYALSDKERIRVVCLMKIKDEVNKISSSLIFGGKSEPYATEQEMIDGFVIPTYESLSESEKMMYDESGSFI
jgi:hypothetical protein